MEAGAEDANLIICVTASDELNILAGLMAKKMGTRHTIARVRNPDDSSQRDFMRNQLVFSMIVNPELEAASEICRVLSFVGASSGSTGGGIKISRIVMYCKSASKELRKALHSHSVETIEFENQPIDSNVISSIQGYLVIYLMIFAYIILL